MLTSSSANEASPNASSLPDRLRKAFKATSTKRKQAMFAGMLLLVFLAVGAIAGAASVSNSNNDNYQPEPASNMANYTVNSTCMALSIIARGQGLMADSDGSSAALQAGIVQKAFTAHNAYHGMHPEIQEYLDRSTAATAQHVVNTADDIRRWPLDRFSIGNALLQGNDPTYGPSLDALRDSLQLNRRSEEGGLWYWDNYPEWSFLDGMYSLGPFVALDARPYPEEAAAAAAAAAPDGSQQTQQQQEPQPPPEVSATANIHHSDMDSAPDANSSSSPLNDLRKQFQLLWDHCLNSSTNLLVHGYDASRTASWAGLKTGASGVVWGRSLGWFAMALVDTLEALYPPAPSSSTTITPPPAGEPLLGMLQTLAASVMGHADARTRGWYQVVDMPGREGNYVESSATAMFAYALLKSARLGYLDQAQRAAVEAGTAAYALLASEFVYPEGDGGGTLGWNGTVAVCSLNSSATYDYYVSRPIAPNSVLGSAVFVMTALEIERLAPGANTPQ